MSNVESYVREKLLEVLKRADIEVRSETFLPRLPGWDSLKMMSLLVSIEKQYGFRFQAREVTSIGTFGELVSLVASKAKS